jgi:signal transduction histidine kinase/ligand-binding sensor domain-containing protein
MMLPSSISYFSRHCRVAGLAVAVALSVCSAQEPTDRVSMLTTRDGMPQGWITTMYEDRQGFLWFGGRDGLDRFDGHSYMSYRHDPNDEATLGGLVITAITEDSDGDMWAGTLRGGVNRICRRTGRVTRVRPEGGLIETSMNERWLVADDHGVVWTALQGQLECYDISTQRSRRLEPQAGGLPDGWVSSVVRDRGGAIWVFVQRKTSGAGASERYVCRYDRARDRFRSWSLERGRASPRIIGSRADGSIILDLTSTQPVGEPLAWRFDPRDGSIAPVEPRTRPPKRFLLRPLLVLENECWFGVFGNLRGDPLGRVPLYRAPIAAPSLRGGSPHALRADADARPVIHSFDRLPLVDRSGSVWFAVENGVARIDRGTTAIGTWKHDPERPTTLSAGCIRSVHVDRHGVLWAGSDAGLSRFDPATRAWRRYPEGKGSRGTIPHGTVNVIHEDETGLYFGTNGGLYLYDRQNDGFLDVVPPGVWNRHRNPLVWSLARDRQGRLWVGTRYSGILRLDRRGALDRWFTSFPGDSTTISGGGVWSMLADRTGSIWIGTSDGLCRWNASTDSFVRYERRPGDSTSLAGPYVWSILEDGDGCLWASSYGSGLSRYDRAKDRFTRFTTRTGLGDNRVTSMLEDRAGAFWLGTPSGLVRWDRRRGKSATFDDRDGLQGKSFALKACFADPHGRLYFGGTEGLSAIDPHRLGRDMVTPPIAITAFYVLDTLRSHQLVAGDSVTLSSSEDNVAFEFAVLDVRNAARTRYAYMLEGVDNRWVHVGAHARRARYTDLLPGTYTFRVRGASGDGVWDERGVAVTVVVHPPWWRTWWSALAGVSASLGVSVTVARSRSRRKERRERELRDVEIGSALESQESERQRVGRDLHDGVGQLLAATTMTLAHLQHLIGRETVSGAHRDELAAIAAKAAATIERAVNDVRSISHALGSSTLHDHGLVSALEELLSTTQIEARTRFDFIATGTEQRLRPNVETGLFRVVQELVANVIRHAGATEATIQIVRTDGELRLTVEDNGCGFDSQKLRGMGTRNVAARVAALRGTVAFDSMPGHGTTVTVVVPDRGGLAGD